MNDLLNILSNLIDKGEYLDSSPYHEYFYALADEKYIPNETISPSIEIFTKKNNRDFKEFYSVLYLARQLNNKIVKNIDKCGSFYADIRPCSEDCAFCPLSGRHYYQVKKHEIDWKDLPAKILDYADKLYQSKVRHFKIVTTGAKSDSKIIPFIAEGISKVKSNFSDMIVCISEGTLDKKSLLLLKKSGVDIFNNNLETSRSRFSDIVKTHTYDDKINAIKTAKEVGLQICSGGLFGIGENLKERIELFITLNKIGVDSSPFNFFVPFPNLPLSKFVADNHIKFSKNEIYYTAALYRLINPKSRLVLSAGRNEILSDEEQEFLLRIGVSALASSGYFEKNGFASTSDRDNWIFEKVINE